MDACKQCVCVCVVSVIVKRLCSHIVWWMGALEILFIIIFLIIIALENLFIIFFIIIIIISPITHLLSMLCVLMKIVSHASAKKKTERFKGFKFRTVIGRFQVILGRFQVIFGRFQVIS